MGCKNHSINILSRHFSKENIQTANKHEKCSAPIARETWMKRTLRFHPTSVGMAAAKSDAEQTLRRMWGAGPTPVVGGDANVCGPKEISVKFPQKQQQHTNKTNKTTAKLPATWSSYTTLEYRPKGFISLPQWKLYLYNHAYCCSIHSSQEMETMFISINIDGGIKKLWYINMYM